MNFASGNSEDDIGKWLGNFYTLNTNRRISGPYSAIGYHDNLKLKGVVVFMDYTGSNIELHGYLPGCLNKKFIKKVCNYIFNELKCNVLRVKVEESNKRFKQILIRLGFVLDVVLDDYFGLNKSAIVYKFRRSWAKKWVKLVDLDGQP